MGRNRFVQPDIVRLTLSDGDYIDIKKELNAGETRRVFGRMVKDMRAGESAMLDPEQVGLTRIVEYLVGWSFTDGEGRPVDLSEGAINNLDQDTYREIADAIKAHEEKIDAEREARKNGKAGTRPSEAISASVGS
jgi:hypothetical protein